jgi:alkanesulfonate monooxygenase SsuD/methylene tetrahydromethanopterin reductase-like flavin-dependent oxidoreductase (luciferase family)
MALAAEHTTRIRLGTGITVVDTRIPPVIAHSIATINQLAPGRVTLGIGAGHTAWRTMGIPPVPIRAFRHCVEVCQGLLTGQSVQYRSRGRQNAIHFQDTENGYINIADRIPIFLAASHPRAQALAGELGDGVITLSVLESQSLKNHLAAVSKGWDLRTDGKPRDYATVTLGVACVLRPGEAVNSPRVLTRVGPRIAVALHYAHEQSRQGGEVPAFIVPYLTAEYQQYLDDRWQQMHATHSRQLHPGEDIFITPDAIRALSLTGTRDEVVARIKDLEAAGLSQFVISPPWNYVEESIVEFAREIISNY